MSVLPVMSFEDIQHVPLTSILSSLEKITYTRHPGSKRKDWLVGRFAAKCAITEHIQKQYGRSFTVRDIEIVSHTLKKPSFHILNVSTQDYEQATRIEKSTIFSIAHSNGFATAAASDGTKDCVVGVDIEKVRLFANETLLGFMTPDEYQLFERLLYERQELYATLLWCIKEAYLKAKGTGLALHPKYIEVRVRDVDGAFDIFEDGRLINTSSKWTLTDKRCIVTNVHINKTQK